MLGLIRPPLLMQVYVSQNFPASQYGSKEIWFRLGFIHSNWFTSLHKKDSSLLCFGPGTCFSGVFFSEAGFSGVFLNWGGFFGCVFVLERVSRVCFGPRVCFVLERVSRVCFYPGAGYPGVFLFWGGFPGCGFVLRRVSRV